eukprot:6174391-Pleurochrysis_carterae.AAC.1
MLPSPPRRLRARVLASRPGRPLPACVRVLLHTGAGGPRARGRVAVAQERRGSQLGRRRRRRGQRRRVQKHSRGARALVVLPEDCAERNF